MSYDPDESFQLTIPPELRCPITGELMEEPIIAEDGHTYDRKNLAHYLETNKVRYAPPPHWHSPPLPVLNLHVSCWAIESCVG
jgi:hypothetical protein